LTKIKIPLFVYFADVKKSQMLSFPRDGDKKRHALSMRHGLVLLTLAKTPNARTFE
jgi:hypothetical protein